VSGFPRAYVVCIDNAGRLAEAARRGLQRPEGKT
jgi:hypothetical protein